MRWLVVALLAAALVGAGTARADVYDDHPAAASRGPGDLVLFARGEDGAIYERHATQWGWTDWVSLGGDTESGPAAVSYGGAIHVFVVGSDSAVWQNSLQGTTWSGWHSLGGTATSAPSASARTGTNQLDLAIRGLDNAIYHRWYAPESGWAPWGSLGGSHASGPSLNSQDPGILNVFTRGSAGDLAQRGWSGTAWSDWLSIGGVITAAPAALSRRQNLVDVFVRGTDLGLHQRSWTGATGWLDWTSVDPAPIDSAPAAVSDTEDHVVLFARRGNGISVKEWRAASGWTGWSDWGPVAPPPTPGPPARDGNVQLTTGVRCTPPGGRLRVSLKIRKRAGTARPRVRRVVFFVKRGPRSVDRRRPFVRRLRLNRPAGSKGRVYARAFYTRKGSKRLHRKTVSKRYVMCG